MKTYFFSGRVEGCLPAPLAGESTGRTASPLDDVGLTVSENGAAPVAPDRAVASVLVVEAESLEQAVALAQGHPGLALGTEIEVRPVKAVPPPPG